MKTKSIIYCTVIAAVQNAYTHDVNVQATFLAGSSTSAYQQNVKNKTINRNKIIHSYWNLLIITVINP